MFYTCHTFFIACANAAEFSARKTIKVFIIITILAYRALSFIINLQQALAAAADLFVHTHIARMRTPQTLIPSTATKAHIIGSPTDTLSPTQLCRLRTVAVSKFIQVRPSIPAPRARLRIRAGAARIPAGLTCALPPNKVPILALAALHHAGHCIWILADPTQPRPCAGKAIALARTARICLSQRRISVVARSALAATAGRTCVQG